MATDLARTGSILSNLGIIMICIILLVLIGGCLVLVIGGVLIH
ncbi:MAG: hypothetical protein ACXVIB_05480 [Halobacteriota archaeon]